jgi:hypothetical protein
MDVRASKYKEKKVEVLECFLMPRLEKWSTTIVQTLLISGLERRRLERSR